MKSVFLVFLGVLCASVVNHSSLTAGEPTYWQDVRPVLRKNCTFCHNARHLKDEEVSAGLALDTYEAILKGGKTPVIRPGKAAESLLVQVLHTPDPKRRMPLDADPLPPETQALIRRWIDAGAKEGTRPAEDASVAAAPKPPARVRKRDVVLATKLPLPRGLSPATKGGMLELALPVGPLPPVTAVVFSPDGKLLAAGSYGRAVVWDLTGVRPAQVLDNVLGAVNDLRFSPDGRLLAVAGGQPSARGDLRLYRVGDWKLAATLGGHADTVSSVAFSPDGRLLASASFDKTVRVWDVASGKVVQTLTGHSDFVYAVAFSPDGKWVATASKDRTVRLTEALTGKSLGTLSGMELDVMAVAVSRDGQQVVSSGQESAVFWWDAKTGERTRKQAGHDVAVHELAFAANGQYLASAGADGGVRIWDGTSGAPVRAIPVGSVVYAVALRPDGKVVASGGFEGLVRLWEPATGRPLVTLVSVPDDWLALTPEAFAAGSDRLVTEARWRADGQALPAERVWPAVRKPEAVAQAARGEKVGEPVFAPGAK
jgi:dipeptidyl aminopeptidase/acylaminoacyl peptidase